MSDDMIDSTSDDRTANNSTRQQYRVLTDDEKNDVAQIKTAGADLIEMIAAAGGECVAEEHEVMDSRNLELARRHVEDAVMRAVRHITS